MVQNRILGLLYQKTHIFLPKNYDQLNPYC
jgi:hypothetical protein